MLSPVDSENRQMRSEAERFIQSALNALSAHIAILNNSGEIIGVNDAWHQFATHNKPKPADYMMGANYLDACDNSAQNDSPHAVIIAQGIREIIAGRIQNFEHEYPCHNMPETCWFVVRVTRFLWHHELRVIVAHQDISELRNTQIEAEIREKERIRIALEKERRLSNMREQFLSVMSHELRTPIASIRLSYDMLAKYDDRATKEEKEQYLDNIKVQITHLNEMLSDFMTLSKSDQMMQDFNPELTDLITYCRDVVEAFQINHHQTHHIEFECPQLVITAEFDKKYLRHALTNLIGNAIKYTPEGGTIVFKLWQDEATAIMQVIDSGIGIPQADANYLFGAFHRATNVGDLPGTGLGLTIAQQLVTLHQGTIVFESEIGVGTTFTIHLPLVSHEPSP